MSHPDEGLIHAWLDGELDAEEAARVERLVAEDAAWAAAAAEARGLIAASARILSHLDSVPGDVLPKDSRSGGGVAGVAATPVTRGASKGFTVQPWMRLAAGFVLVAGVGYVAKGALAGPQDAPIVAAEESAVAMSAPETTGPSADRAVADVAAPTPVATGKVGARVDAPAASQAVAAKATAPSVAQAEVATGTVAKSLDSIAARERSLAEASAVQANATQSAERLALSSAVITAAPAAPEARREAMRAVGGAATSGLSMRSSMAALADASTRLAGCWQTTGATASDSLLVNPLVLRSAGDTLVIAISAKPDSALVRVQSSTTYSGTVIDANGRRVAFSMTRVVCPARP
ncbi:MAG: hypothetical protein IT357_13240 [Gemmatimonadaceae bacterium]|nr:hypothetical protein [Gemmatimonadaceae bacterium]